MALHLTRRHQRFPSNPSLIRFFSNSSSDSPPKNGNASAEKPSQSPSSPSSSSYSSPFADIKTTLKLKIQNQNEQGSKPIARSDAQSQNRGSRGSFQDPRTNLAKFERRSTVPPSSGVLPTQSRSQVSFEELYKKKPQDVNSSSAWENLKNLSGQSNTSSKMNKTGMSLGSFKSTWKTTISKGKASSSLFGGAGMSVLGKEIDERKGKEGEAEEMTSEFLKTYSEKELGEKLTMLRPDGNKEEGWFSLEELNRRLVKLRQVEEKEFQNRPVKFAALRKAVETFKNDPAKKDVISSQNFHLMDYLCDTPAYKLHPPKDGLVETYFHPDNLSSAEKMKIELTKVREEFKMSESDCGSARVQVAQLTTKIKHLSKALHKKDKHSRKGLLEMVQKRKKLLKYLRRTDWDSYCLVLSKLELRDNPDYKF